MSKAWLVIGTGRSGTSLITQNLGKLGVMLAQVQVPPSENNLSGTGESVAIRDAITALNLNLGSLEGFRPDNWEAAKATQETKRWIIEYLKRKSHNAGGQGFAIKFPLNSIFLPLWSDAAKEADVDIGFIWSTRNAFDTINSNMKAYNRPFKRSMLIYAQRIYYILRDAPGDTLLIPYEGWHQAPAAQTDAMASFLGLNEQSPATTGLFSAKLDHSDKSVSETTLPEAIAGLDTVISGYRGRLDAILDRSSTSYFEMLTNLSDLISSLQSRSQSGHSNEEHEMRLKLLNKITPTSEQETSQMDQHINVLTQRIRDVTAENRGLVKAASQAALFDPNTLAQLQELQAAMSQQLAQTLSALHVSQDSLQNTQARLSEANQATQSYATQVATLQGDISALQAAHAQTAAQLQDAHALNADLESRLKALEENRNTLLEQLENQAELLEAEQQKLAYTKDAYAKLTAARDALEENIENRMRWKMQDLESREAKHRTTATNWARTAEKRQAQIDELNRQKTELAERVEALDAQKMEFSETHKTQEDKSASQATSDHLHKSLAALGKEVSYQGKLLAQERERRQKETASLGALLEQKDQQLKKSEAALQQNLEALNHERQKQDVLKALTATRDQLLSAIRNPLAFRNYKRAQNRINEDMRLISASGLFDTDWYLQRYPDVTQAKGGPLRHFALFGAYELRDPGPGFDSFSYHLANPDVTAHGMAGLIHYVRSGASEGRKAVRVTQPG